MGSGACVRKRAWFYLLFSMFKPHLVLLSLLNLVFCGVSVSLFPLTVLPLTSLKLLIVVVGRRTNEQENLLRPGLQLGSM